MKIEIFKEKMEDDQIHVGYKIIDHGFKGHSKVLENWFATKEGFKKNLLHYIEQYIGREDKNKKRE